MKVTVDKYLNRRTGSPSVNAPCYNYYSPGDMIEITGVVIGDEIQGNCIWYKLEGDNYCWSGGVKEKEFRMEGAGLAKFDESAQVKVLNTLIKHNLPVWKDKISGFRGVSAGRKNNIPSNPYAVIFLVEEKKPESEVADFVIPLEILFCGFAIPADVAARGVIRAFYVEREAPFDADGFPYKVGGSLSRNDGSGSVGTRGVKVKRGDEYYILTCYHVLAYPELMQGTYEVTDGTSFTQNRTVSVPAPQICGLPQNDQAYFTEGKLTPFYEFALAKLSEKEWYDSDVYGWGKIKGINRNYGALLGQELKLFGIRSLEQTGVVLSIASHPVIAYGDNLFTMYDLIETTKMSIPGDSGAPVLDKDFCLVGMLVAGGEETSYIIPVDRILENNNLEVCFSC